MMGNKSLREIKDQLRDALAKAKPNPIEELERELRRLEQKPKRDERTIENVRMIRDALAGLLETPDASRQPRAKSKRKRPRTIR